MADQRSAEARAYRRLYNTRQWRSIRANQLSLKPLCEIYAGCIWRV
jgi:5-methylcytosine-specific restriction protein A